MKKLLLSKIKHDDIFTFKLDSSENYLVLASPLNIEGVKLGYYVEAGLTEEWVPYTIRDYISNGSIMEIDPSISKNDIASYKLNNNFESINYDLISSPIVLLFDSSRYVVQMELNKLLSVFELVDLQLKII